MLVLDGDCDQTVYIDVGVLPAWHERGLSRLAKVPPVHSIISYWIETAYKHHVGTVWTI